MPRVTGRYERTRVGGEEVAAFIPEPLPSHDPPLGLSGVIASLRQRAEAALGLERNGRPSRGMRHQGR